MMLENQQEWYEVKWPQTYACALMLTDYPLLQTSPLSFMIWGSGVEPENKTFLVITPDSDMQGVFTETFRLCPDAESACLSHLKHGTFNINAVDRFGVPPLISACELGSARLIERVLSYRGVDASLTDTTGRTALQALACRSVDDPDMEKAFLHLLQHPSMRKARPDREAYVQAIYTSKTGSSLRYVEMLTPRHKWLNMDVLLNSENNHRLLRLLMEKPCKGLTEEIFEVVVDVFGAIENDIAVDIMNAGGFVYPQRYLTSTAYQGWYCTRPECMTMMRTQIMQDCHYLRVCRHKEMGLT